MYVDFDVTELAKIDLVPAEARKVTRKVQGRLLTLTQRQIRSVISQVLTGQTIKRRLRVNRKIGRIYGYENPITTPNYKNYVSSGKQFRIKGVWFERIGPAKHDIRPVRVPIKPEVDDAFQQAQDQLESQWYDIMEAELDDAINKVLGV